MLKICISLFITGIMLGSGPCLASCGPVLISYLAATKKSMASSLLGWLIFSAGRVFIYIFLGALAGIAGSGLFKRFYWEPPGYIIWIAGGIFISFLGVLVYLGKESHFKVCSALNESFIGHDIKSLLVLGVLVGIAPCAPLIGIFSYITMASNNFMDGVAMSAAFGAGTMVSPLLLFAALSGSVTKLKFFRDERHLMFLRKACGAVLFILGVHIITKAVIQYMQMP